MAFATSKKKGGGGKARGSEIMHTFDEIAAVDHGFVWMFDLNIET